MPAREASCISLSPTGDEGLKIKSSATLPTSPTIDPATNGLRMLVTDALGVVLLDTTVPGGARGFTPGA